MGDRAEAETAARAWTPLSVSTRDFRSPLCEINREACRVLGVSPSSFVWGHHRQVLGTSQADFQRRVAAARTWTWSAGETKPGWQQGGPGPRGLPWVAGMNAAMRLVPPGPARAPRSGSSASGAAATSEPHRAALGAGGAVPGHYSGHVLTQVTPEALRRLSRPSAQCPPARTSTPLWLPPSPRREGPLAHAARRPASDS